MWRYFAPAVAFLVLGALFAFTLLRIGEGKLDVHEIQSPLIGKAAPAFALPSVADPAQLVDSHALAGKMYVLNVWGTWCGGCREEHPALLEIARSGGVPLIGIDWKDERDVAVQYLAELGNPYQQVASDADGRVAIDWGVYGAPETFLISDTGTVLVKHIGPITAAAWQEKFVPHLKAGGGR
jgi:cytochrome c biogenesis protein CcmG/thiol:disulfide interchange protein DsbE